jgi:hypothetical protein
MRASLFVFLCLMSGTSLSRYVDKFCNSGGDCPDIDVPFKKLLQGITAKGFEPRVAFFPKGRSLQAKKNGTSFTDPRIVSVSNDGNLFVGYSKKKKQIEIIEKNPETGENEFFLVSDYPENPRIEKQEKGSKCFECHKGGELLFSNGPWDETNANPMVAFEMCLAMKNNETGEYVNTYEGIRFTEDCASLEALLLGNPLVRNSISDAFASVTGIDSSVRQNQKQRYFDDLSCQVLCDLHKNPVECKKELLQLMILSLDNNSITPVSGDKRILTTHYSEIFNQTLEGRQVSEDQMAAVRKRVLAVSKFLKKENYTEEGLKKLSEQRFTSVLADFSPKLPLVEAFMKNRLDADKMQIFQKEYDRRRTPALLMKKGDEKATFDLSFSLFLADHEAGLIPDRNNPQLSLDHKHFYSGMRPLISCLKHWEASV